MITVDGAEWIKELLIVFLLSALQEQGNAGNRVKWVSVCGDSPNASMHFITRLACVGSCMFLIVLCLKILYYPKCANNVL